MDIDITDIGVSVFTPFKTDIHIKYINVQFLPHR